MPSTANIPFTIFKATDKVFTNNLTPVSAVPATGDAITLPWFKDAEKKYSKTSVIWDFGDGTTYTTLSAEHVYKWPGTYTITLSIIDNTGEVVNSTTSHEVTVVDFLPTQYDIITNRDVIDIPTGQPSTPIRTEFYISWQSHQPDDRPAPQSPTKEQYWYHNKAAPGYWSETDTTISTTFERSDYINKCGAAETIEVEIETDTPIYTFNYYLSGSDSIPVNKLYYDADKWSHLNPHWYFKEPIDIYSFDPVSTIQVKQRNLLTQPENHPNTYDRLFYMPDGTGGYVRVSEGTPGSTFVGVSGNAEARIRDDTPKNLTSRETPMLLTVEMESTKIIDYDQHQSHNQQYLNYNNVKQLPMYNIKSRINQPTKLSITSNGLNEFALHESKWTDSGISYCVTFQDQNSFNILNIDTGSFNINVIDAETSQLITTGWENTRIESRDNHYRGCLTITDPTLVGKQLKIVADATYNQSPGYMTDAFTAWLNGYRPPSTDPEYGEFYKARYIDQLSYDGEYTLSTPISTTLSLYGKTYITSGIISSINVTTPGSGFNTPPGVTVDSAIGSGAQLAGRIDDDGFCNQIDVLSPGIKYSSTDTLAYTTHAGVSLPIATINVDNHQNCKLLAVDLSETNKNESLWTVDCSTANNFLLNISSTGEILKKQSFSTLTPLLSSKYDYNPTDLILDSEKHPYILLNDPTYNRAIKLDKESLDVLLDIGLPASNEPLRINIDQDDNIYILCKNSTSSYVYKYSPTGTLLDTCDLPFTIDTVTNDSVITRNNTIIFLTQNNLCIINTDDMSIVSTTTHSGNYYGLSLGIDNTLYTLSSSADTVVNLDQTGTVIRNVSVSGSTFHSLANDSRGYIWLIDDISQQIKLIDTLCDWSSIANNTTDELLPGHINNVPYPTPDDDISTGYKVQTIGDWTGFQWLYKYGYIEQETKTVSGESSSFTVHSTTGTYNIRKINEYHDQPALLKSYALQPWLSDNAKLWNTTISSILGDIDSSPMDLGKQTHERIANFVMNMSDIDTCLIDSMLCTAEMYDISIESYTTNFPSGLQRVIDICSIPMKRLFGQFDKSSLSFDQYTQYTTPEIRENLGPELDFNTAILSAGTPIVAYELFSREYTVINVTSALSGEVLTDSIENTGLVDVNSGSSDYFKDNFSGAYSASIYPLSAYSPTWRWELLVPNNVVGNDLLFYYKFFKYNITTENKYQVEGVINWDDPQTTLTPEQSGYGEWSRDGGIVDNIIEHQLRTGLNILG